MEIRSGFGPDGRFAFTVHAADRVARFGEYEEAVAAAGEIAKALATEETRRRGAPGELRVEVTVDPHRGTDRYGTAVDLGTTVSASAGGRLGASAETD